MLTWPAAGKLDELTLRKERCCLPPPASLPMVASTTLQMLVRIRGLATACPTVYWHREKESQRGALAYRKPQWLLLRVERWAVGTLYIKFHTHHDPGYALLERQEWEGWWGLEPKPFKNQTLPNGEPGGPGSAQCLPGHSHHPRRPCTPETASSRLCHLCSLCLSLSLVVTLLQLGKNSP